jgi:NADH-quinone oxidoreductase subunit H
VTNLLADFALTTNMTAILTALIMHVVFFTKVLVLLWIFVWVRWTLPRFRYDQLMDLGWKTMLPWALANVIVTAVVMAVVGG